MARKRNPAATRCEVCGRLKFSGPTPVTVPVFLLAGSLLTFYLVGLPLLAAGIVMAVRRDPCRCGETR